MLYTKLENNFQETPFVALDLNQVSKQVIGDTYEVIEDHAIDLEIVLADKALVMCREIRNKSIAYLKTCCLMLATTMKKEAKLAFPAKRIRRLFTYGFLTMEKN